MRRAPLLAAIGAVAALTATTSIGVTGASAAIATSTVTIDSSTQVQHPWLGFGLNYYPEPDESVPNPYTAAEKSLDQSRLDYLKPNIVRLTWHTEYFSPSGTADSFDWTTQGSQNEFAGLDYLKAKNIPVMTGWWSTPWSAVGSDYSTTVADFLNYLIKTKGYTNIKYWDGINEPNHRDPSTYANFKTSSTNVQNAINARGLNVKVIGPATQDTSADNWITSSATDLSGVLGAYEKHLYPTGANDISDDSVETYVRNDLVGPVDSNDPSNKPFITEETGYKYGYSSSTDSQAAVTTYGYGMDMADLGVQIARAGATPMAWWLDDLGNKVWGMFDATASDTSLRPWFTPWALMERYFPAGASIYAPTDPSGVRILAAKTASGSNSNWAVEIVNTGTSTVVPRVVIPGYGTGTFAKYVYTNGTRSVDANGFPVADGSITASLNSGFTVAVPPDSTVFLATSDHGAVATSSATSTTQTDTDVLTGLNDSVTKTGTWAIDTTNPSYFSGDAARAERTTTGTDTLVYPAAGSASVSASIYSCCSAAGAAGQVQLAYSSSSSGPWTSAGATLTAPTATAANWYAQTLTNGSAIPASANYVQLTLTGGSRTYSPELGQLQITHSNQ